MAVSLETFRWRLPGGLFPRLVALFPFIFPLYLFRGILFGIPVTLPELLLVFLFLYFLFDHEPLRWNEWKKLWPVGLFFLAGILGVFVVPSSAVMMDGTEFPTLLKALGVFKGWVVFPVLYFVMARSVFREKPSLIKMALHAFLFGAVLLALTGLYQVVTGEFLTADGRASGPFESANYLALYVGPAVVYGLFSTIRAWQPLPRFTSRAGLEAFFLTLCTGIVAAGLYFTQSYAAFIAVFVAMGIGILIFLRRSSPYIFWGVLAGGAFLGAVLLFSVWGSPKFEQFLDFSGRSSSSVRVQVYAIALDLLRHHPFFGIGLGQFEQQYQEVALSVLGEAPFEWNMLHPHNLFLATWLSMGLLGLIALVAMIVKALQWLLEEDSKQRPIVALMLITVLVHGLFDTPYFKNDLAFEFFLFLAMLL